MQIKNYFILLFLFLALCSFGRKFNVDGSKQIDSLKEVEDAMSLRGDYDSVITVCKYALAINKKYARQEHIDMDLILAYFKTKHYDEATKLGRRYLNKIDMPAIYSRTARHN